MKKLHVIILLLTAFVISAYSNNVLIKIEDPDGVFNKSTLQNTVFGFISDANVDYGQQVLAYGNEMQLHVDSTLVGYIYNNGNHYFYLPVFITAGDTITLTANKVATEGEYVMYNITASGKNEGNYNYLAEKHKYTSEPYIYKDNRTATEHKKYYQNKRNKSLSFLYEKKNTLTSAFYNYELACIENNYAYQLYNYNNTKIAQEKSYFNDVRIIRDSIYINLITWEKFCYDFSGNEKYSNEAIDYLTRNYSGIELEFLLTKLLASYVFNGIEISNKLDSNIEKHVHDNYYLSCVKYFIDIAKKTNVMLPDSVLNETYLIEYKTNRKLTLKEFFAEQESELLYIDFWASWCGACRVAIREDSETKQKLNEEKYKLVYFSLDTDENRWKVAVKEDGVEDEPNYLIVDAFNSSLSRYLDIHAIPHYSIINKLGKLIKPVAPRL